MTKRRRRRHHEQEQEQDNYDAPIRTLDNEPDAAEPDHAGNASQQNILGMQQKYGNAYVQRKIGTKNAKADAAADEDRLIQLLIDGVMAFEDLASYWPVANQETEPEIPGKTPEGLRPAMQNLVKAKIFRYGIGLPDAEGVVKTRLAAEGPIGFGKMVLYGPKYIKQIQLDRQKTAKTSWQMARPIFNAFISRYEGLNGANADYAARLRRLMFQMDYEVTTLIPRLTMELEAMMTPEESTRMRAVSEAKQAVVVLQKMGKTLEGRKMVAEGNPIGESIKSSPAEVKIAKGMDGLGKLQALIELYESPAGFTKAIGEITEAKDGGMGLLAAQKGVLDITKILSEQVKGVGRMLIEGAAELYDLRVEQISKAHPGDIGKLANAAELTRRANVLREFAAKLEGLERFAGAMELLSGTIGLIQGIEGDDFEALAGGVISMAEGAASLASPALGVGLMPWMASAKGMVHVVAQTSRMLQNIQNDSMKKSLKGMEEELNVAALNAKMYELAMTEWFMRYNSPDPVEKALGEQYADKAEEKAAAMQKALWEAFSRVTQGTISKFPILANTFDMAFGGHDLVMDTWRQLQSKNITSQGDLMTHAEFLSEVVMKLSNAMSDLSITMQGLEDDVAGKVDITGSDRNSLTFQNKITLGAGGWTIEQAGDDIEFDGPIDNQNYKDWLAAKLHGKTLGEMKGILLNIEAEVMGETITMSGIDGNMFSSSTLSDKVLKALAQALLNKDAGDDSVTSDQVMRALWRLCLQNVRMPDGKYFK